MAFYWQFAVVLPKRCSSIACSQTPPVANCLLQLDCFTIVLVPYQFYHTVDYLIMANSELVDYYGTGSGSSECGYCKRTRERDLTYGMWAYSLSPESYQLLVDRNWRRSGHYCYKPINDKICCPLYTIRCDANNFKLRQSHKKVIKNFNNYIKYDVKPKRFSTKQCSYPNLDNCQKNLPKKGDILKDIIMPLSSNGPEDNSDGANVSKSIQSKTQKSKQTSSDQSIGDKQTVPQSDTVSIKKFEASSETKINVNKKKYKRRLKLIQKVIKRNNCSEDEAKIILFERSCKRQKTKTLEQFMDEYDNFPGARHTFKTTMIVPNLDSSAKLHQKLFDLFEKYQVSIHKDDHVSFSGFKRFLIDSPLETEESPLAMSEDFGSLHQLYYIDDKLVAVAVIDILPRSLSSVYLFYDPEFAFLNLGVYSALSEIALVRKYSKIVPDLKYYYMGYYIHSCPKMRYKAQYLPSDLLCSETFKWVSIETCITKLTDSSYARFCDDPEASDEDFDFGDVLHCVRFSYENRIFKYSQFTSLFRLNERFTEMIKEFARLVGKPCVSRLVVFVK